ncbi:hypothetical protein M9434_000675 [Picochlorum sp. BPE23]|nr:hypothetical protein M9434_000675 [Picochlorum sp. BPE23]
MSGANVRKRTREEEELAQSRPQIQRRSKIEIGYIVAQFRRKVIANNGLCTGCGKQLMSLNELAEYEFDFTQETVVKHADQKCVHPRVVSLDEDIVMSTGICVSDESEDDSREENEEDGDEDEDEDEGQPGESSEHCDSWECHLLLNADPIQAKGSRQTGLMVRNHLGDQVRPGGQTLAEILHFILSEDRPVHVIEDMLKVARTSSGNEFMPKSFHVLKQALHMRSLAAVDIHIFAISARALSVIGMESSPKDSNAICQVDWNLNRTATILDSSIKSMPCIPMMNFVEVGSAGRLSIKWEVGGRLSMSGGSMPKRVV